MKKIILALLILCFCLSIVAEESVSFQSASNTSAYFYSGSISDSERLKIYTYVWGQVEKTGLYIVPDNTDLLALISLAGGPTENAKLANIRIVRPTADGSKVIFVDLKEYIETGNEDLIPVLKPGDTVIVAGSIYYAFFRVADFMSKVAIVVSVIAAINNM